MTYGDLKKWCTEHNITDDHKIQFMNVDTEEWFVSWEKNPFDRFTSEDCKRLFFEMRLKTEKDYENELRELESKRSKRK